MYLFVFLFIFFFYLMLERSCWRRCNLSRYQVESRTEMSSCLESRRQVRCDEIIIGNPKGSVAVWHSNQVKNYKLLTIQCQNKLNYIILYCWMFLIYSFLSAKLSFESRCAVLLCIVSPIVTACL